MVFGIVGCASVTESIGLSDVRNDSIGCANTWSGCRQSSHKVKTEYKNVDLEPNYSLVAYPKAEAMNLKTGEKFHFGHSVVPSRCNIGDVGYKHCPKVFVQKLCEDLYASKCILSRFNDEIYYQSLEDYKSQEESRLAKREEEKREMLTSVREQRLIAEKLNGRSLESMTASEKDSLLKEVRKQRLAEETPAEKRLRIALEESRERKKQELILELNKRCEEYGFTGESNISACIQREAQHDKELAMQSYELEKTRLALQQAQSRAYTQNVTEPVQKEEDLPFLIKFLGDVAMGVAENLADPSFQRDMQQQRQINELKANQNRDIYRDCRPNC